MDHNFLWYGISVFVNDVLYKQKIFLESLEIKNIVSVIENNIFHYSVIINEIPCDIVYTFDSNIAIEGKLTITNLKTNEVVKYNIERRNDSVRIGKTISSYHEIYEYLGKNFIDISVERNIKVEVTNLNISEEAETEASASIVNTTINDNRVTYHNMLIDRLLFAVSGAIDYDITKCIDVICLKCSSLYMVIYDEGSMQVISVDTKTFANRSQAEIHPINSNFKQFFEYTLDNDACEITEFITTVDNPKAVRRKYGYSQDKTSRIITAGDKQFSVVHKGNDITFIRMMS